MSFRPPNLSAQGLAVVEAIKALPTDQIDEIAKLMEGRISSCYYEKEIEDAEQWEIDRANHFAVMLLFDIQGKP